MLSVSPAPVVYPTDAPLPKKQVFQGSLRFTKEEFKKEYANKSSDSYLKMANKIETAVSLSTCYMSTRYISITSMKSSLALGVPESLA